MLIFQSARKVSTMALALEVGNRRNLPAFRFFYYKGGFFSKRLRIGMVDTLESKQFIADLHLVVSDIETR